ncbi:MAG: hypothetical protein ACJ75Q_10860 [Gaiellaceae bacterium]
MKLIERFKERRRGKAHRRYVQEREREEELSDKDTQQAIRNAAEGWGVGGQGTSGDA